MKNAIPVPGLDPDQASELCELQPDIRTALDTRPDIQSPARSCFKLFLSMMSSKKPCHPLPVFTEMNFCGRVN